MSKNIIIEKLREKLQLMGDPWVWLIVIFLCLISVLEVYSASSRDTFGQVDYWATAVQHGRFLLGGFIFIWGVSQTPYLLYRYLCPFFLTISIGLLIFLALGHGVTLNGGTRWIDIYGIRFQPSEVTKICLVASVAWWLAKYRDREINQVRPIPTLCIGILTFVICGLIFKENISTAGIIGLVILMMCWIGRAYLKWLSIATICISALVGTGFLTLVYVSPERIQKIDEFIDSNRLETAQHRLIGGKKDPVDPHEFVVDDYNRQKTHAKIAVSSGGIIGKGPGRSEQREYLPMAFSDFIYSIILEEGGILGGTIVLGLYILLLFRSLHIARRCRNLFPAYLVMGLSLMLVLQALINMSVAVGAVPVTGQPLPLVSKGGTSTLMTCLYFGIILSVSYTAKQKPEESDK